MAKKRCRRPNCDDELNTGRLYCSPACAAKDRKRTNRLAPTDLSGAQANDPLPTGFVTLLAEYLGDDTATVVANEVRGVILEETPRAVRAPTRGVTEGGGEGLRGWRSREDRRSSVSLGWDQIDRMMRCGPVRFALELKLASILSVFRNPRSWCVSGRDAALVEVVEANLTRILPYIASQFMTCLEYGVFFGEQIWEYRRAIAIGVPDGGAVDDESQWWTLRSLNACHPKTIDHIRRTAGGEFDGFVQKKPSSGEKVTVGRDQALVITHQRRFRNMWGYSVFEPVHDLWYWYELTLRAFLRYLERSGTPVTLCRAPGRGKVKKSDGTSVDAMDWGLVVASDVAKSNAAVLPSDVDPESGQRLWELSYLTDDKRGDQFITALRFFTQLIARAMLVGDRSFTQDAETGSYAAATQHWAVTEMHNERILDEVIWQLNMWLMPRFVLYNRGRSAPPVYLETEGLDPGEKERLFKLIGVAGNTAADALQMVDWDALLKISNVPVLSGRARQEKKRAAEAKKEQADRKLFPSGKPGSPAEALAAVLAGREVPVLLSLEEALAIQSRRNGDEDTMRLYNPYHDELGRFATAAKSVITTAAKDPVGAAAKAVKAPGEFLARKDNKAAFWARTGLEVASDVAISVLTMGWTYANASVLGAAAVSAFSLAVFGAAAPAAALTVAGVVAGIGAALVVSEGLDYAQDRVVWAYMNRSAPRDDQHIYFTKRSALKKTTKAIKYAAILNPINLYGVAAQIAGKVIRVGVMGTVIDVQTAMPIVQGIAEAAGLEEAPDEGTMLTVSALWPLVAAVVSGGPAVLIPDLPETQPLLQIGFRKADGRHLYIDRYGALEFEHMWESGAFPPIGDVSWGGEVVVTGIELEGDGEPFLLFNPYHDKLGRFSTKAAVAMWAGSVAAVTIAGVGRVVASGLERHGEVKQKEYRRTGDTETLAVARRYTKMGKATRVGSNQIGFIGLGLLGVSVVAGSYGFNARRAAFRGRAGQFYQRSYQGQQQSWQRFTAAPKGPPPGMSERRWNRAYRAFSKKFHPDVAEGMSSAEATKQFQALGRAYEGGDLSSFQRWAKEFGVTLESDRDNLVLYCLALPLRIAKDAIEAGDEWILFDVEGVEIDWLPEMDGAYWMHRSQAEYLLSLFEGETVALEDGDVVFFYNPYHDELGRFTTSSGRVLPSDSAGREAAVAAVEDVRSRMNGIGKVQMTLHNNPISYQRAVRIPGASLTLAGYYDEKKERIHINPTVTAAIGLGGQARAWGEHILRHEVVHSRKRKGSIKWRSIEEASAEALTRNITGQRLTGSHPYDNYVDRIGRLAMSKNSGDREESWKWISDLHAANYSDDALRTASGGLDPSVVEKYLTTGKGITISRRETLFDGQAYRLEDDDPGIAKVRDLLDKSDVDAATDAMLLLPPEKQVIALVWIDAFIGYRKYA